MCLHFSSRSKKPAVDSNEAAMLQRVWGQDRLATPGVLYWTRAERATNDTCIQTDMYSYVRSTRRRMTLVGPRTRFWLTIRTAKKQRLDFKRHKSISIQVLPRLDISAISLESMSRLTEPENEINTRKNTREKKSPCS